MSASESGESEGVSVEVMVSAVVGFQLSSGEHARVWVYSILSKRDLRRCRHTAMTPLNGQANPSARCFIPGSKYVFSEAGKQE